VTRAVITFHGIDDSGSVLSYPQSSLVAMLEGLRRAAVPIVPLDALLRLESGVTLTFDDGMASVLTQALPVLQSYAAPAHLFVVSDYVGATNRWPTQPAGVAASPLMDWPDLEACRSGGLTIEAHTRTHPDLTALSDARIHDEFEGCNELIERRLGSRPRLLAYPYGYRDARVEALARPVYEAALTTRLALVASTPDPVAIPRIDSYYLRHSPWREHPLRAATRAWLGMRSGLRRLAGGQ